MGKENDKSKRNKDKHNLLNTFVEKQTPKLNDNANIYARPNYASTSKILDSVNENKISLKDEEKEFNSQKIKEFFDQFKQALSSAINSGPEAIHAVVQQYAAQAAAYGIDPSSILAIGQKVEEAVSNDAKQQIVDSQIRNAQAREIELQELEKEREKWSAPEAILEREISYKQFEAIYPAMLEDIEQERKKIKKATELIKAGRPFNEIESVLGPLLKGEELEKEREKWKKQGEHWEIAKKAHNIASEHSNFLKKDIKEIKDKSKNNVLSAEERQVLQEKENELKRDEDVKGKFEVLDNERELLKKELEEFSQLKNKPGLHPKIKQLIEQKEEELNTRFPTSQNKIIATQKSLDEQSVEASFSGQVNKFQKNSQKTNTNYINYPRNSNNKNKPKPPGHSFSR